MMRKLVLSSTALVALSGSAFAADYYQPPVAEQPDWTWTGLYVGGTGGYAFGDKGVFSLADDPDYKVTHDLSGPTVGGMIGGNYQLGSVFVLGAEFDGFWTDIEGNQTIDGHIDTHSQIDAMVLAKGRAGIAWERALLYVTGGYAGADLNADATYKNGLGQSLGNKVKIFDANTWANGWVLGGGADIKLTDNWFAGVEYDHIEFKDVKLSDNIENWNVDVKSNIQIDQIVGRVGFHF
jgi:outer membrane immunogenic protein